MKPDVIVTWPRNCDYPLWRQFIHDNRQRFNEIIVVFMETNQGADYRQFVRDAMFADHVLTLNSPPYNADQDWRDVAIHAALAHSLHSNWIWFTEQDFFPKGDFFKEVDRLAETPIEYIGVNEGERLHPCCLFVKRRTLNLTRRKFGIVPDRLDHFGMIQEDLSALAVNGALLSPDLYMHMAGLSQNLSLIERKEAPNHKVEQLDEYLKKCLSVTLPLHKAWVGLYGRYLAR